MRKLTREIVNAFLNGNKKTKGNTSTDGQSIWLHGNQIVETNQDGQIVINNCGWGSVTTRERLNGLLSQIAPHLWVHQSNFNQYVFNALNKTETPFEGDYIVGGK
jgi:hypothetical protein